MKQMFIDLETKWMNARKNKDESATRQIITKEFKLTSSLSDGALVNKEAWIEKAIYLYDCYDFKIDKLQARMYDKTAVLNIWFIKKRQLMGKTGAAIFYYRIFELKKKMVGKACKLVTK